MCLAIKPLVRETTDLYPAGVSPDMTSRVCTLGQRKASGVNVDVLNTAVTSYVVVTQLCGFN